MLVTFSELKKLSKNSNNSKLRKAIAIGLLGTSLLSGCATTPNLNNVRTRGPARVSPDYDAVERTIKPTEVPDTNLQLPDIDDHPGIIKK